jgi:Tfp pilus assembly protein PilF
LLWREQRRTLQALATLRESEQETFKIVDSYTMRAMGRYTIDSKNKQTPFDVTEANEFYKEALRFYDRIARKTDTDSATRDMVARANQRSGFTRMMTGQPGGEEAFRRAVAEYEKLVADEPTVRAHRDGLRYALDDWAMMTYLSGKSPAAEPIHQRASELAKESLLAPDAVPESLPRFAANEMDWAARLDAEGRTKDAEKTRNDLAEFYRQLSSRIPAGDVRRTAFANAHFVVAEWSRSYDRSFLERLNRLALGLDPEEPTINNNLAWLLCARPDQKPHDPAEAVALAEKAVTGLPQNGMFWNTLGVARFRLGENEPARKALERSMELSKGGDPNDWFVLAMLSVHDGDREKAREWYEKSTAELKKKPTDDPDLLYFQSEAAARLGIKPSQDGPKADQTKQAPRHEEDSALDRTPGAKGSPPPPRGEADTQD